MVDALDENKTGRHLLINWMCVRWTTTSTHTQTSMNNGDEVIGVDSQRGTKVRWKRDVGLGFHMMLCKWREVYLRLVYSSKVDVIQFVYGPLKVTKSSANRRRLTTQINTRCENKKNTFVYPVLTFCSYIKLYWAVPE